MLLKTEIDLETGDVKWTKKYDSPTVGPNGVTIGYDKVYGATIDFAFALDRETGDEVWRSQKLTRNANEGIDMAPAVFDETLYVSTVPGNTKSFYKGNGAGVLWALDAQTGKEKWRFWTVPENLWSNAHTEAPAQATSPPAASSRRAPARAASQAAAETPGPPLSPAGASTRAAARSRIPNGWASASAASGVSSRIRGDRFLLIIWMTPMTSSV